MKILKYKIDILPLSYILLLFLAQLLAAIYLTHIGAVIFLLVSLMFFTIPAAFSHHQQHHPIFYSALLNRLFEILLGFQTACTPHLWVLHHVYGHHFLYLDPTKDTAKWRNPTNGKAMSKFEYAVFNFVNLYRHTKEMGKKYPKQYTIFKKYHILHYVLLLLGVIAFGFNFFIIFVLLPQIVLFFTIETTWYHHANLAATNDLEASRNNVSRFFNLKTCNLGYHTAHHLKPALHWSLLPQFHEQIKDKIPTSLIRKLWWHA
jgi:fatty acid desaturase